MVKFLAIKINYDDRDLAPESKYAVVPLADELERFRQRFENEGRGGYGFHEGLNFQIKEDAPVQAYLPPNGIPQDMDDEYVIFSSTYQHETLFPSTVLGVHGAANLISKHGVSRPGMPRIGKDKLSYHFEADSDFVTLFSSPLPYDPRSAGYVPLGKGPWGNGLRYITPSHAANILSDALAKGAQDLKSGSNSYRAFVQREIKVINRIRTVYGLDEGSSQKRSKQGSATKKGAGFWGLPDKILGEKGEEFVFRREQKWARKEGFKRDMLSWASQSNPTLPYDIATVRYSPEGHREHFIEVKSTTLDDLTNIYVSPQQIDHMKDNPDASSFVVLLFGRDGKVRREWTFSSVNELLPSLFCRRRRQAISVAVPNRQPTWTQETAE
jgi:hypothetical protein